MIKMYPKISMSMLTSLKRTLWTRALQQSKLNKLPIQATLVECVYRKTTLRANSIRKRKLSWLKAQMMQIATRMSGHPRSHLKTLVILTLTIMVHRMKFPQSSTHMAPTGWKKKVRIRIKIKIRIISLWGQVVSTILKLAMLSTLLKSTALNRHR